MIGQQVEHPIYGPGKVVAMYRNGEEWLVRFTSGLRFRRSRGEFTGQTYSAPRPAATFSAFKPAEPMPPAQFEARQLIESLRVGIAPAQYVRELTIGFDRERENLVQGLSQTYKQGGAVRAVLGEYGYGKSHMIEFAKQEALADDFLVATTSLDLLELPPHRSFDIYSSLMRNLSYPDSDEQGLGPLLEKAIQNPGALEAFYHLDPVPQGPLSLTLEVLSQRSRSLLQQEIWTQWLEGGRRRREMRHVMPRGLKFPSIYKVGHNARQVGYLLGGISALARLTGYRGLCLLIDEAESYSLLRTNQRPKATLFFKAMIYTTLRDNQPHIDPDSLPNHRYREYPPAFGKGQALFFMFTVTHSDNSIPLDVWLTEKEQIIDLDTHPTPQEISQFLLQVQSYHALAYSYIPTERHGQIRRGAAEHLAQGLRNYRFNTRGLVRLAIELYDLLYLYPDYDVAGLLGELREQML